MQVGDQKILSHGGYTIKHPTKRMAFHIVTDFARPFAYVNDAARRQVKKCPTCNTPHFHKTYHIMLNEEGRAVVSPGVYRGLLAAGAFTEEGGLQMVTHTTKPPNQVLGTKNGMMGLVPQRPKTVIYHE